MVYWATISFQSHSKLAHVRHTWISCQLKFYIDMNGVNTDIALPKNVGSLMNRWTNLKKRSPWNFENLKTIRKTSKKTPEKWKFLKLCRMKAWWLTGKSFTETIPRKPFYLSKSSFFFAKKPTKIIFFNFSPKWLIVHQISIYYENFQ